MEISTIKHDANGNPDRTKYMIVALGNMDPHEWNKSECYDPVLSLPQLRLIICIAIRIGRVTKTEDVIQAFCQQELLKN